MGIFSVIWSVISWCFGVLPKAWPYISDLVSWVINWKKVDKAAPVPLPLPKREDAYIAPIKESDPIVDPIKASGAPLDDHLAIVSESMPSLEPLSTPEAIEIKPEEKKSLNSGLMIYFKKVSDPAPQSFMTILGGRSGDKKFDPIGVKKNTSQMRIQTRMGSKLL